MVTLLSSITRGLPSVSSQMIITALSSTPVNVLTVQVRTRESPTTPCRGPGGDMVTVEVGTIETKSLMYAYYLTKNTPGMKKGWPRTKTGLAEKDVKSNGQPRPPGFDRFESFGHNDFIAKIVILGAQGLLMLMGTKFLIKITRLQTLR